MFLGHEDRDSLSLVREVRARYVGLEGTNKKSVVRVHVLI